MEIDEEWSNIAQKRLLDRLSGNDSSYNNVLLPIIYKNVFRLRNQTNNILDYGCGTGELTYEISKIGIDILGLDISKHSILLARENFKIENLTFTDKSIFEIGSNQYDLIIANMSLMDTSSLNDNFTELYKKLNLNGTILITITHPAFWPIYWDYCNGNFNYLNEQKITQIYKTRNTTFEGYKTSHYHRPISYYINLFVSLSLRIKEVLELRNPADSIWYPRFLYFELQK